MTEYPYMVSNTKIGPIFEKLKSAEVPQRFTLDILRKLGFTSTNDRAFIPLIKKMGFLTADGTPTSHYNQLRDISQFKVVLAERIKETYSDLFSINTRMDKASDAEIKGAISRVTGKDAENVNRYFATFKALLSLADFDTKNMPVAVIKSDIETYREHENEIKTPVVNQELVTFHYNIQIHLPLTTDINIYNAIFKSIKDNLLDK